jgi:hypothetical protein
MLSTVLASLRRPDGQTRAIFAGIVVGTAWSILAVLTHPSFTTLAVTYIPLFIGLVLLLFLRVGFDLRTTLILTAGVGFYLAYLGYTEFGERNYDGPAELDYIQYVADTGRRPPAARCLICHHPPLYYYASAVVFLLFKKTHLVAPELGLQIFSLGLFIAFLVYAIKLVRLFVTEPRLLHLATALIVFWPYSVMMCVRVHNDNMAATLMMIGLYYVARYYQQSVPRDLYLAAVFAALGLLTKSSAFVIVGLIYVALALKLFQKPQRLFTMLRGVGVTVIFVVAIAINAMGRGAPTSAKEADFCHKVLGNACNIGRHEWVGNEPYNYLYVDPQMFFKEPYLIAGKDGSGRELFWNDLIKTSLFGTHNKLPDRETAYELNRGVAGIMNGVLFGMTAYLLAGLAFTSKPAVRKYGIVLMSIASCIVFMMAFRMMIPAPHHTDFRHVFVVLVPTTVLYVAMVGAARRRDLALEWIGRTLAITLVALSIFYYWPKREIVMRFSKKSVPYQLSAYSHVVAEGTPWDADSNLLFEENETVEFALDKPRAVTEVDITLDNNDRYELTLFGDGEPRKVELGPSNKKEGLARYVQRVTPQVENVHKITLRAVSGDQAYSMGHLILR